MKRKFKHTLLKYTEEQLQKIEKQIEAFSIDEKDYEETPEELERSWQQLVTRLKREGVWKED
ncbi:hypothetical protein [Blautia sp.]|uniref:hypothetical protein n=1 Tax=Blautia sp. TaxID=1955243 RepID=UPI003AB56447